MAKKIVLPESALTPRQRWLQKRFSPSWKRATGTGWRRIPGEMVGHKPSVPTKERSAQELRKRRDSTRAKRAKAQSLAMRDGS